MVQRRILRELWETAYRASKYERRLGYEAWCRGESFIPKTITPKLVYVHSSTTPSWECQIYPDVPAPSDDSRGGIFSSMTIGALNRQKDYDGMAIKWSLR